MDAGVGRIDETLHDLGLAENTLVLFTSDNGPAARARATASASTASTAASGARSTTSSRAASGCRRSSAGPTGWPAGALVPEMLHFTDWLPTLARGGRRFPPPGRTGWTAATSRGVLGGDRSDVDPTGSGSGTAMRRGGEGNAAMRDGDWKLVRPSIPALMQVTDGDRAIDRALNLHEPDRIMEVDRSPLPEFDAGRPSGPAALRRRGRPVRAARSVGRAPRAGRTDDGGARRLVRICRGRPRRDHRPLVARQGRRLTQRKPRWLVVESTSSSWRAAGRYREQ